MTEASKAKGLAAAKAGGKASAALRKEQTVKLERFRAEVVRRVLARRDGDLDPIEEARVDALCGLYLIVIRRCRMSGGINLRINPLAYSATVTSMRSLLREFGLAGGGPATPQDDPATEDLHDLVQRFTGTGRGLATDASANVTEGSIAEPE